MRGGKENRPTRRCSTVVKIEGKRGEGAKKKLATPAAKKGPAEQRYSRKHGLFVWEDGGVLNDKRLKKRRGIHARHADPSHARGGGRGGEIKTAKVEAEFRFFATGCRWGNKGEGGPLRGWKKKETGGKHSKKLHKRSTGDDKTKGGRDSEHDRRGKSRKRKKH